MPKYLTNTLKILLASAMLFAVVYWVQVNYGWRDTLAAWSELSVYAVGLLACGVFVSHVLRVARVYFAYRLQQPVAFERVAAVSFVHNTVSFLLPMRLGELVLPALSKHQLAIDYRYSTAVLVIMRLFDAHVLLCLLTFFAGDLWLESYALIAPFALIAGLPVGMKILSIACSRLPKLAFASRLVATPRDWITLYLFTLAIWTVKLFALAYLAALLGQIPLAHSWIATILADGSALSPVTGFANAGTFELVFAMPLAPLGYSLESLVRVAVNVHIFIFVTNIMIGIVGFTLLRGRSSSRLID
ncbi:lysylphosphatidylglycerol synthase transmembrane domain-containing protein [Teredinibacter turnerae]|uniref:lysylphosphatidylglycerol synthase transmembrane domain-containing protein n=1 Tax=Teredinibacter turnerae TaxID=2426 RepID=UPI0003761EB0|nr:lysylphosphatidylglycerol synthase transmembrane domain-containing protein [Teredinibacter turnerae]